MSKFTADIDAFIAKVGKRSDAFLQTFAYDLFEDIVNTTPVQTGFLRSNWMPNIGSPATGTSGNAGGVPNFAAASTALSAVKATDIVYLTNNTEYGTYVEYGTKNMRPRAMVRTALARTPILAALAVNKVKAMYP